MTEKDAGGTQLPAGTVGAVSNFFDQEDRADFTNLDSVKRGVKPRLAADLESLGVRRSGAMDDDSSMLEEDPHQYASQAVHNEKLLNNKVNKQKTKAYGDDRYDMNSVGRDMGIDISNKGGNKKKKVTRKKKPGRSSFGEADINESSLVVVTEEKNDSSPERKRGIKPTRGGAKHLKKPKDPNALAFTFDNGSIADIRGSRVSKNEDLRRSLAIADKLSREQLIEQIIQQNEYRRKVAKAEKEARLKKSYLDYIAEERRITVQKLRQYLLKKHPKQFDLDGDDEDINNWSLCKGVSNLQSDICFKRRKISDFSKNIGPGPAVFLSSLKSYIWLLFVLSLLNIPACMVLYSGNYVEANDHGGGLTAWLSRFSLGNIGTQNTQSCTSIDLAKRVVEAQMSCPQGNFTKLLGIGFQKDPDQQICNKPQVLQQSAVITADKAQVLGRDRSWESLTSSDIITRNYVELSKIANSYTSQEFRNSGAIQGMATQFDTSCRGTSKCTLNFDYLKLDGASFDEMLKMAWASRSSDFWQNYDVKDEPLGSVFDTRVAAEFNAAVPEPLLYIIAECDNQNMEVSGLDVVITKQQLNYFLVVSDAIIMTVFIVGYNIISHMQKDFVREYDASVLEARDFTLVIEELPNSFRQHTDELSLKRAIFAQLQEVIEEGVKEGKLPPDCNRQVLQIALTTRDIEMLERKRAIKELMDEFAEDHSILLGSVENKRRFERNNIQSEAKIRLTQKAQKLQEQIDIFKLKFAGLDGCPKGEPIDVDEDELKEIDALQVRNRAKELFESVQHVYVTFASCRTKLYVEGALGGRPQGSKKFLRIGRAIKAVDDAQAKKDAEREAAANEDKKQKRRGRGRVGSIDNQYGSLYLVEDAEPGQIHFIESFKDKKDERLEARRVTHDPSNINWIYFGTSLKWRCFRFSVSFGTAFAIAGVIMLSLYGFESDFMRKYLEGDGARYENASFDCRTTFTADQMGAAAAASAQFEDLQVFTCFCRQQYDAMSLLEFLAEDQAFGQTDEARKTAVRKECRAWFQQYAYLRSQALGPALITVGLLNTLGIGLMWEVWRHAHKLVLQGQREIAWFDLNLLLTLPILTGVMVFFAQDRRPTEMQTFDNQWYLAASSSLAIGVTLHISAYYAYKLIRYLHTQCVRCCDRGGQYSMIDDSKAAVDEDAAEDDGEQRAKTKQVTQEKLNQLYQGPEFDGSLVQSQVILLMSICLMFSAAMPLLYPVCCLMLTGLYWLSKFTLLKYQRHSLHFNESLVLHANKVILVPILLHFLLTFLMLWHSPMLAIMEQGTTNFDSKETFAVHGKHDLQKDHGASGTEVGKYLAFLIVCICGYLFNLFIINPITCFFIEGCCTVEVKAFTPSPSTGNPLMASPVSAGASDRASSIGKAKRRMQKYAQQRLTKNRALAADAEQGEEDIERGEHLDVPHLEHSPMSHMSRRSVGAVSKMSGKSVAAVSAGNSRMKQYKCGISLANWKKNLVGDADSDAIDEEVKQRADFRIAMQSGSFLREVQFETLRTLLRETVDQMVKTRKRIHLYERIVRVNEGSKLSKIFQEKVDNFEKFYDHLSANKDLIDAEVDFYWDFINKYIDNQADFALQELDGFQSVEAIQLNRQQHSVLSGAHHNSLSPGARNAGTFKSNRTVLRRKTKSPTKPLRASHASSGMFDKISLVKSEMESQSEEHGDVMGGPSMLRASLVPVGPKIPEIRYEQMDIDIDLDLYGSENGSDKQQANGDGEAAQANEENREFDSKSTTKIVNAKQLNKVLNKFQRMNSRHIMAYDDGEERDIRESARLRLLKLEWMNEQYDEEWLRLAFLHNRFRCSSYGPQTYSVHAATQYVGLEDVFDMAEVILKDPVVIELKKIEAIQEMDAKKQRKIDSVAPIDSTRPDDTHRQLMQNQTIGDQSARLTTIAANGDESKRNGHINETELEIGAIKGGGNQVNGESKEESLEVFKMAEELKIESLANRIGSGLESQNQLAGGIPIIGMRSSIPASEGDDKSQAPQSNINGSMIYGKRQLKQDEDQEDFKGESVKGSVFQTEQNFKSNQKKEA